MALAGAAEREAQKLADDVGERKAKEWFEGKLAEIETKSNERLDKLKTWFESRLAEIEGKKKEPEPAPAEPAGEPAAPAAPSKRKRLRI